MKTCSDHDFAMWAFGDAWMEYLIFEKDRMILLDAWNARHGDLEKISKNELIEYSLEKMKKLWKEHGKMV